MTAVTSRRRIDWLEPVKGLALLGIILNHLVEEFGPGPWFTNPTRKWPVLSERLHTIWPGGDPLVAAIRFLGWLGDATPGVFILASGLGLAFASAGRPTAHAPESYGAWLRRRLARILPLYVAMYLIVALLNIVLPGTGAIPDGYRGLLNLFGIRPTAELFFSVNPSWWFVWLVLQLYLVYPLLFRLLRQLGRQRFLGVAFAITAASRAFGILAVPPLFAWMTGMFAGTRLAEFAIGMVLGEWLQQREATSGEQRGRVLSLAALAYVAGFAASLVLWGTLVSNLLVTIGLTGLFWGWSTSGRSVPRFTRPALSWLGERSFPIFLFHQMPLRWTVALLPVAGVARIAGAVVALAASVPISLRIERVVEWARRQLEQPAVRVATLRASGVALLFVVLIAVSIAEPTRQLQLALWTTEALGIVLLTSMPARQSPLGTGALVAAVLAIAVLPPSSAPLAVVGGLTVGFLDILLPKAMSPRWRLGAAAVLSAGVAAAGELALRTYHPLETSVWGELPALRIDKSKLFALKPDLDLRLRYNDYDYRLRTNSDGLASPPLPADLKAPGHFRVLTLGDAFMMPEAVDYDSAFSALLQQRLRACAGEQPVDVINGGVTGYGPRQSLAELRELLPRLRPHVVVYEYFINEPTDLDHDKATLLSGIGLAPGGESRRERFLGRLQLVTWAERSVDRAREMVTGVPSDRRRMLALAAYYRPEPVSMYGDSIRVHMTAVLDSIAAAASTAGARLLLVYTPGAAEVQSSSPPAYLEGTLGARTLAGLDISRPYRFFMTAVPPTLPVIDLRAPLSNERGEPSSYQPTGWHWTPAGHRRAAEATARELAARGLAPRSCLTDEARAGTR